LVGSGGATAGGEARINWSVLNVATGGAVIGGGGKTVYDEIASGGVVIAAGGFANGLQFRKLLTIAPLSNLTNFPFMFRLTVQENLNIARIKATTVGGDDLPSEFISYTNNKLCGLVRTDLDAVDETEVYVYYGGES
jgi:hypothetical protein